MRKHIPQKGSSPSANITTAKSCKRSNVKRNAMLWMLMFSSAILLSVPFLYPHLGLVSLVAFVPLLAAEQIAFESKKRFFFIYYYVCFLLWNLATTYWIYNATVAGMIAAVVLNALQMAVIFRLFRWMRTITKGFLPYLFLITAWLAWEHVYFEWEVSWPWLTLGNAFATSIKSIQWYEYTGTLGGSLWVLLFNVLFFRLIYKSVSAKCAEYTKKQRVVYVLSILLLLCVPLAVSHVIFGSYKEVKYEPSGREDVNGSRQFVLLQPNVDPYKDKFRKTQDEQNENLMALTREALDWEDIIEDAPDASVEGVAEMEADFVIAPETFLSRPPLIQENEPFANRYFLQIYNFTRKVNHINYYLKDTLRSRSYPGSSNVNFILGAVTDTIYFNYRAAERKNGKPLAPTLTASFIEGMNLWFDRTNTALFIDAKGDYEFYHKSKLVVLVESTPYKKLFNLMSMFEIDLGGGIGSYATQPEREVFTTSDSVKIGTAICYESVYGNYYREYVLKGAHVMSIITNDGWWGDTPGYHQHLSYASLRAIETRRSIARSANTGISALINQRGEIIAQTNWWERDYLKGELYLNDQITIFVKHGDIIGRLAGFLFFLFVLMAVVRTISRKYITTAN